MTKGAKKRRKMLEKINSILSLLPEESTAIEISTSSFPTSGAYADMWNNVRCNKIMCGESNNMPSMFNITNRVKPTRIIFNIPATICFFSDGEKIVAKCSEGEEFIPEYGVMACIMKKIFGTRSAFLRMVEDGVRSAFLRTVEKGTHSNKLFGGKDD